MYQYLKKNWRLQEIVSPVNFIFTILISSGFQNYIHLIDNFFFL